MSEQPHPMDADAPFILAMMREVVDAMQAGDKDQAGKLLDRMLSESSDPATTAAAVMDVLQSNQP